MYLYGLGRIEPTAPYSFLEQGISFFFAAEEVPGVREENEAGKIADLHCGQSVLMRLFSSSFEYMIFLAVGK